MIFSGAKWACQGRALPYQEHTSPHVWLKARHSNKTSKQSSCSLSAGKRINEICSENALDEQNVFWRFWQSCDSYKYLAPFCNIFSAHHEVLNSSVHFLGAVQRTDTYSPSRISYRCYGHVLELHRTEEKQLLASLPTWLYLVGSLVNVSTCNNSEESKI